MFSSVLTAATSSVLQAELDSCRELLQLEPENKCEAITSSLPPMQLDVFIYNRISRDLPC